MTKERFKKGDTVKAFHPGMFGVVKTGTVVKLGSTYVTIDFGELNGGQLRVRYKDVLEPEVVNNASSTTNV